MNIEKKILVSQESTGLTLHYQADAINLDQELIMSNLNILVNQLACQIPSVIDLQSVKLINDMEFRSLAESLLLPEPIGINCNSRFLFLAPIGEQGYNFGQFRLASHLIKLGIPCDNIYLFPLEIGKSRFDISYEELIECVESFKPEYICEIAYVGWEDPLIEINSILRNCIERSNFSILLGGPFTTSHTDFCLTNMLADIVFLGHGEYLFENYLKAVFEEGTRFPQKIIPGVLYPKRNNIPRIPFVNQCLDVLYWDPSLMIKFCKLRPIVNLFTSDVCFGNCIFCYRLAHNVNYKMSNQVILQKLETILQHPDFKQLSVKYVRFLDDDFFAAKERDSEFLCKLRKLLIKYNMKLYDLTFSVRSFMFIYNREGQFFLDSLKSQELKRIVVGVDGFNDSDLKSLRKGYSMKRVFEFAKIVSQNHIPTLMYAILTTFATDESLIAESLSNMVKLVSMEYIYIGPAINPILFVSSDNVKMYPSFVGDKFKYLNIENVSNPLNGAEDLRELVMLAAVMPVNRLVRDVLGHISFPTKMETAYLIPILNVLFRCLAIEEQRLLFLQENVYTVLESVESDVANLEKSYRKLQMNNEIKTRKETVEYINRMNSLLRQIVDAQDTISLCKTPELISDRIDKIRGIVLSYNCLCNDLLHENKDPHDRESLGSRVRALSSMPLSVYRYTIEGRDIRLSQLARMFELSSDEIKIFHRLSPQED